MVTCASHNHGREPRKEASISLLKLPENDNERLVSVSSRPLSTEQLEAHWTR